MVRNTTYITERHSSFQEQVAVTVTIAEVIDAMEVVGFKDQGKEEVADLIKEKFHELVFGNFDVIPEEMSDQIEIIKLVVEYLVN